MITAEDGGIINDPVLLRLGENHFWLALADSDVLLWAQGVALNSGLRGEHHRARRLAAADPGAARRRTWCRRCSATRPVELRYYWFLETEARRHPGDRHPHRLDGEVGYEVYLRDGSRGDELWERIMEAGKPTTSGRPAPRDIRRIEAGILNWGADMTLENNPLRGRARAAGAIDGDDELTSARRARAHPGAKASAASSSASRSRASASSSTSRSGR